MIKRLRTRFLIASGGRARWVEYQPDHADPVTLAELTPAKRHRPGGPPHVSFESVGGMRHGPDPHEEAQRRLLDFADELAEDIERQARSAAFDRLGLVAPARLLSAIRERLAHSTLNSICFELQRDLTKHSNHALSAWLGPSAVHSAHGSVRA